MDQKTRKQTSWTKWTVHMTTGDKLRPWGIYGNGVLCWKHERFTTAIKSVLTDMNYTRWDKLLRKWKPGFLVDGVEF